MATYDSAQALKEDFPSPKDRNSPLDVCGDVLFFQGVYTVKSTEVIANNDLVDVVILPVGVQLLPETVRVSTDGLGGTGAAVATLGDALDDDRYSATSIAVVNAGQTALTPTNAIMAAPHVTTEATRRLKAKIALSSGSLTNGRVLRVSGQYVAAL